MSSTENIRVAQSDQDLRQHVVRFLNSRHFPVFRNLDIEVERGSVTLSGVVHSYYEKQIALTSCQTVPGVMSLVDQVSVESDYQSDFGADLSGGSHSFPRTSK
jgi:osmotically-inducible protein OsmY